MAVGRGTHGQIISNITMGDDGFHVQTGGGKTYRSTITKDFFSLITPIRSQQFMNGL